MTLAQRQRKAHFALRVITIIGALPVIGYAGWVSYWHGVHVVLRAGETPLTAHMFFFSVEGMMLVAGIGIASKFANGNLAKATFGLGVAATIVVNVLSANPTILSRAIAVWPAIALILTSKLALTIVLPHSPTPTKKPVAKKATATKSVPAKKTTTNAKRTPNTKVLTPEIVDNSDNYKYPLPMPA